MVHAMLRTLAHAMVCQKDARSWGGRGCAALFIALPLSINAMQFCIVLPWGRRGVTMGVS